MPKNNDHELNTMDKREKVNPKVDIAFKKIFGVEENKDLLISLVNSIVGKEDQIVDVELLNPYNPKNFKKDKLSVVDIKAKSETGKRYNIEVQISDEGDYDDRALYYWAKLYTEQLGSGDDYSLLSKAIGIHILNFTSIPGSDQYHNAFHITEKEKGFAYFKNLELHTIELNKFAKGGVEEKLSDLLAKVKNAVDIWATFLARHDLLDKDHLPPALDNPALKKAIGVLEVMNFTPEERETYEDHLKYLRMEVSTLKKRDADWEEKVEAIKAVERAEGRAEGREEEKLGIARNLLAQKVDIQTIATATGLSVQQIKELAKNDT